MINVCIYCGNNKLEALEVCDSCHQTPQSHTEVIHSIIMCFSEDEPYLNFLSLEDIERIRDKIINNTPITIQPDVFSRAEEAYSAVKINEGPKAMQYFASISFPVIAIVFITILSIVLI